MASLFDDLIPYDDPTPQDDNLEVDEVPTEETEDVSQAEDEDIDDRADALYNYLVESSMISAREGFRPTTENMTEILDSLPEELFTTALSSVHENAQDLLDYSFRLGPDATIENLKKFFDSYVAPAELVIETEEDAYNFLKEELKQSKVFRSEDKLIKYLEDLQDDDTLLETAKEKLEEKQAVIAEARKAEIEQVKQAKLEQEQQSKQFYQNIYETVDGLSWDKSRKAVVLKNIEPKEVSRKNQLILKSPMALVQLADIYSRFDEKTGQFDLTNFEMKTDSKATNAKKDELIKNKLESSLNKIRASGKGNESSGSFFSQFSKTD